MLRSKPRRSTQSVFLPGWRSRPRRDWRPSLTTGRKPISLFAPERWTVTQTSSAGATVTFTTEQAFTSTISSSLKRDARLDLALASSDTRSGRAVSVASDQTSYASASEVAKVQASSTAPGSAAFDLTVTFVTGDVFTLEQGDYVTTVTGTIAAK